MMFSCLKTFSYFDRKIFTHQCFHPLYCSSKSPCLCCIFVCIFIFMNPFNLSIVFCLFEVALLFSFAIFLQSLSPKVTKMRWVESLSILDYGLNFSVVLLLLRVYYVRSSQLALKLILSSLIFSGAKKKFCFCLAMKIFLDSFLAIYFCLESLDSKPH